MKRSDIKLRGIQLESFNEFVIKSKNSFLYLLFDLYGLNLLPYLPLIHFPHLKPLTFLRNPIILFWRNKKITLSLLDLCGLSLLIVSQFPSLKTLIPLRNPILLSRGKKITSSFLLLFLFSLFVFFLSLLFLSPPFSFLITFFFKIKFYYNNPSLNIFLIYYYVDSYFIFQ